MENSIKKFLVRNAIITYSLLVFSIICIITTYMAFSKGVEESRKYLYLVQTDGDIIPLQWVNRRENIAIEMRHHIVMMVENFYSLNQEQWEDKVEKALWLGDFEQLHIKRTNDGYYNRFIQYNAKQIAYIDPEIELFKENGKTMFQVMINLEEAMGGLTNKYLVFVKGEISIVERNFPHNPHGMYIKNFIEERVQKLEE